MVAVDSSVWIDFFNGADTFGAQALSGLLNAGEVRLVVPDLVYFEVLRGFRIEREFRQARALLDSLDVESTSSPALALEAAQHSRALRAAGWTIRSAVDVLVATFCIEHDYALLHADRDYEPFAVQRGLKVWAH